MWINFYYYKYLKYAAPIWCINVWYCLIHCVHLAKCVHRANEYCCKNCKFENGVILWWIGNLGLLLNYMLQWSSVFLVLSFTLRVWVQPWIVSLEYESQVQLSSSQLTFICSLVVTWVTGEVRETCRVLQLCKCKGVCCALLLYWSEISWVNLGEFWCSEVTRIAEIVSYMKE